MRMLKRFWWLWALIAFVGGLLLGAKNKSEIDKAADKLKGKSGASGGSNQQEE